MVTQTNTSSNNSISAPIASQPDYYLVIIDFFNFLFLKISTLGLLTFAFVTFFVFGKSLIVVYIQQKLIRKKIFDKDLSLR